MLFFSFTPSLQGGLIVLVPLKYTCQFSEYAIMYLKNLPIKHKLLLMLILPLLSLVIFSGMIIFERLQDVSESQQLIKDAEFFAEIGATTHNLQKERGTSVAFVSSKGEKMADKLPTLRTDSDKTLLSLSQTIKNHNHILQGKCRTKLKDPKSHEILGSESLA